MNFNLKKEDTGQSWANRNSGTGRSSEGLPDIVEISVGHCRTPVQIKTSQMKSSFIFFLKKKECSPCRWNRKLHSDSIHHPHNELASK